MDKRYAAMTPGSVNPSINSPRFGKLETLINCVNFNRFVYRTTKTSHTILAFNLVIFRNSIRKVPLLLTVPVSKDFLSVLPSFLSFFP